MKTKLINFLEMTGFTWMVPMVRLGAGENAREQFSDMMTQAVRDRPEGG